MKINLAPHVPSRARVFYREVSAIAKRAIKNDNKEHDSNPDKGLIDFDGPGEDDQSRETYKIEFGPRSKKVKSMDYVDSDEFFGEDKVKVRTEGSISTWTRHAFDERLTVKYNNRTDTITEFKVRKQQSKTSF